MKNKVRTQRRNIMQRSKMVAVMAAIFFVLGGGKYHKKNSGNVRLKLYSF